MRLASREYVAMEGLGDRDGCARVDRELRASLKSLYGAGRIAGFRLQLLSSLDDIIEADLDEETLIETTQNAYPFLFLNVTFDPQIFDLKELASIESSAKLTLVASRD